MRGCLDQAFALSIRWSGYFRSLAEPASNIEFSEALTTACVRLAAFRAFAPLETRG
jgi:hypothetical protein